MNPGSSWRSRNRWSRIVENAAAFGWDLDGVELVNAALPLDAVQGGEFDLLGLLAALDALRAKTGARRVVFDGVDVLLSGLDNRTAERREVHRLREWLLRTGVSGMITAKMDPHGERLSQRHAYMEYMADSVVTMRHRSLDGMALRSIRVAKLRGGQHSSDEVPMIISSKGIEVTGFQTAALQHRVYSERVSTGVSELDEMLTGGYYRASSVLISGAPGTAKSTLAGAFAEAACKRGERTLYVSLDEAPEQILRNLTSVGLELKRHVKSGELQMYSTRARAANAEEHALRIEQLVRERGARNIVIDPISALTHAGGGALAEDTSVRLLDFAKSEGITIVSTSLMESPELEQEATAASISTIADTWLHLAYAVQAGERNRALTVVKSRGMRHSNQVRELLLSDEGVSLRDVYTAEGAVLMGTLRWQQEEKERQQRLRTRRETAEQRKEMEAAVSELELRLKSLERQLQLRKRELAALGADATEEEASAEHHQRTVGQLRSGPQRSARKARKKRG